MDAILFLIFAAIAVVCAINLVLQTHPISSALSLVGVMGSLARALSAAGRRVHRRGAADRLRRRHHGAVRLRHHAAERRQRSARRTRRLWVTYAGAAAARWSSSALIAYRDPAHAAAHRQACSSAPSRTATPQEIGMKLFTDLPAAVRSHQRADPDRDRRRDRAGPKGDRLDAAAARSERAALLVPDPERDSVRAGRRRASCSAATSSPCSCPSS